MKTFFAVVAATAIIASLALAHGDDDDGDAPHHHDEKAETVTVTGEVVDMACYIDHNASGEKHAACAKTCIESGLPVGIKTGDGKVYLLIGEHKPINKELAQYAGQTITVRGNAGSRNEFNVLENIEVVKPASK